LNDAQYYQFCCRFCHAEFRPPYGREQYPNVIQQPGKRWCKEGQHYISHALPASGVEVMLHEIAESLMAQTDKKFLRELTRAAAKATLAAAKATPPRELPPDSGARATT
jgi:hypothetical protein